MSSKESQNIKATFVRKFAAMNFKKSPNLVTLLASQKLLSPTLERRGLN